MRLSMSILGAGCALIAGLALAACDNDDTSASPTTPEACEVSVCGDPTCDGVPTEACCAGGADCSIGLAGTYTDEWGSIHTVDGATWTQDAYIFHISLVDEAARTLVARNDSTNEFNPDMWSRFEWTTTDEGQLYYCQVAFDAVDESASWVLDPADTANPATGGCGGFPWTTLSSE